MVLEYRGEDLKKRAVLVREFERFGLKQVEAVERSGLPKDRVSAYFNGKNDELRVEQAVKELIREAKQGIGA
jgi:hypothetical protein